MNDQKTQEDAAVENLKLKIFSEIYGSQIAATDKENWNLIFGAFCIGWQECESNRVAELEKMNTELKTLLTHAILLPNNAIPNGAHKYITDEDLSEALKIHPNLVSQIDEMLKIHLNNAELNLLAELGALKAEREWRVIERDGLPDAQGSYIVTVLEYPRSVPAFFDGQGWFATAEPEPEVFNVIAWRPVPKPFAPSEEK